MYHHFYHLPMPYEGVILFLAIGTVIGQIFVLLSLLVILFGKKLYGIRNIIWKYHLDLAFITALTATLGSLFFSEVMHFPPCELCWFQRIFMYPQAVILFIVLFARDQNVRKYILALSAIGMSILIIDRSNDQV